MVKKPQRSRLNTPPFCLFLEQSDEHVYVDQDGHLEPSRHHFDTGVGLSIERLGPAPFAFSQNARKESLPSLFRSVGVSVPRKFLLDPALLFPHPDQSPPVKTIKKIFKAVKAGLLESGLAFDQVQTRMRLKTQHIFIYAPHRRVYQGSTRFYSTLRCAISKKKSERAYSVENTMGLTVPLSDFLQQDFFLFGRKLGRDLKERLNAKPAPLGKYPVILSAKAGGTFVHEAIGHGLEADLVLRKISLFGSRLEKKIAHPQVTVVDDPSRPGQFGSYAIDDEGTPCRKTTLIEKGVLKSFLHSRETARKMKTSPTGNGRRESYRFPPIVRMSNTFIEPGTENAEQMLREIHRGILVEQMGGGEVDTMTGSFVFEVTKAYWIRNGKKAEALLPVTLAGQCLDVLNQPLRIANDLGFGIGLCGKDGQNVCVSDGQPSILVPELKIGGV